MTYLLCLCLFSVNLFKTILATASPDIFSSSKQPKYSITECCFIIFSFRVIIIERLDLFLLLNKMFLVLSSPKCIESLLSMNHSKRLLKSKFKILLRNLTYKVAVKYTRILCVKLKVVILQCCLHDIVYI